MRRDLRGPARPRGRRRDCGCPGEATTTRESRVGATAVCRRTARRESTAGAGGVAMVWTAPTPRTTGELITASIWNTDLTDNLNLLKTSIANDGSLNAVAGLL